VWQLGHAMMDDLIIRMWRFPVRRLAPVLLCWAGLLLMASLADAPYTRDEEYQSISAD